MDCFGLFGAQTNNPPSQELEEGEIADDKHDLVANEQNYFDTLLSDYEQNSLKIQTKKCGNKCLICKANISKYTCPKCYTKTCSLNCCILHKKNFNCSGVRDKVSFVPLKDYSHNNFISDYSLLENVGDFIKDSNRSLSSNFKRDSSNWRDRFVQESLKRKISYKKLPSSFKKAKLNSSLYVHKGKVILWDIEFIFPYCSKKTVPCEDNQNDELIELHSPSSVLFSVTFKKNRINENSILKSLIIDLIQSEEWKNNSEYENIDVSSRHYKDTLLEQIVVLFKHDSGKFYYKLDVNKSLLENFANKTIVEYPTLVIILQKYIDNYNVK